MNSGTGWDRSGALLAVVAAALFGASTPIAKLLLGEGTSPWMLAGLLYLGSGVGLCIVLAVRRLSGVATAEASLSRADLPWLLLVILSGGIVAPVLLMIGLATTAASSAALLLNVEGLATMVVAWVIYREYVDRRLLLGAAAILAGAVLLSWPGASAAYGLGSIAILGACCAWALDNNLTRRLSAADPVQIAAIKGVVAGLVNMVLAISTGTTLPGTATLAGSGLTGFLGYGVSVVLFILALRHLGTARTSAYFATAPFIGSALSLVLFREPVSAQLLAAAMLMAIGIYLHFSEMHDHEHVHEPMEHEHSHRHDSHHQHMHDPADPPGEPHAHRHHHVSMRHKHPHYPDLHHRHRHRS